MNLQCGDERVTECRLALPDEFVVPRRSDRRRNGRFRLGPPKKGEPFRVLEGPGYTIRAAAVRHKGRMIPVSPEVAMEHPHKVQFGEWVVYITDHGFIGVMFIHNSGDSWTSSRRDAVGLAREHWVVAEPTRDTCSFNFKVASGAMELSSLGDVPSVDDILFTHFASLIITNSADPRLAA